MSLIDLDSLREVDADHIQHLLDLQAILMHEDNIVCEHRDQPCINPVEGGWAESGLFFSFGEALYFHYYPSREQNTDSSSPWLNDGIGMVALFGSVVEIFDFL